MNSYENAFTYFIRQFLLIGITRGLDPIQPIDSTDTVRTVDRDL